MAEPTTLTTLIESRLAQQSFIVLILLAVIWVLHSEDNSRINALEKQAKDCNDSLIKNTRLLNDKYDGLLKMYYFSHDSAPSKLDTIQKK